MGAIERVQTRPSAHASTNPAMYPVCRRICMQIQLFICAGHLFSVDMVGAQWET